MTDSITARFWLLQQGWKVVVFLACIVFATV